MARIGFLACETTLPGSSQRREDAYEHDRAVAAIEPALAALGHELHVLDWEAPLADFGGIALLLLGTAWNYQDKSEAFLSKLEQCAAAGIQVCNPPELVRWNARKTYLQELANKGAATLPTLWVEQPDSAAIGEAFEVFGCERLVVKRQIGAGALGQTSFERSAPPPGDWQMQHPAMIQPFLASIQSEGEYSFIFIAGEFSHALLKRAAAGDYRIQSMYGGYETAVSPPAEDIASARTILSSLPDPEPLYARIDMLRGPDGSLLLMEAELIEPYLYPEQGPNLGSMLAHAIDTRLSQS